MIPVSSGIPEQRRVRNRREAGRILADRLQDYARRPDVVVLGLPRGGVPVAFEIAAALQVPLDVFVVRKLGVPGHEELAMGAVASGGVCVLNRDIVRELGLSSAAIERAVQNEAQELQRRERAYRDGRPFPDLKNRVVILVDDGLATGASMRAAAHALRPHEPARIIVAVPTAARDACEAFKSEVDEAICAITPEPFHAVGLWYDEFPQTTDEEVRDLLARSAAAAVSQAR